MNQDDMFRLDLRWDNTAPDADKRQERAVSFADYFAMLEALEPSERQLREVDAFKERFILP